MGPEAVGEEESKGQDEGKGVDTPPGEKRNRQGRTSWEYRRFRGRRVAVLCLNLLLGPEEGQ